MDNRGLSANGQRSILANRTTSCCNSEELWVNTATKHDSRLLPPAGDYLKPVIQHSQTHRRVIKDNLRLLPTMLIASTFLVLQIHPAAIIIGCATSEDSQRSPKTGRTT